MKVDSMSHHWQREKVHIRYNLRKHNRTLSCPGSSDRNEAKRQCMYMFMASNNGESQLLLRSLQVIRSSLPDSFMVNNGKVGGTGEVLSDCHSIVEIQHNMPPATRDENNLAWPLNQLNLRQKHRQGCHTS